MGLQQKPDRNEYSEGTQMKYLKYSKWWICLKVFSKFLSGRHGTRSSPSSKQLSLILPVSQLQFKKSNLLQITAFEKSINLQLDISTLPNVCKVYVCKVYVPIMQSMHRIYKLPSFCYWHSQLILLDWNYAPERNLKYLLHEHTCTKDNSGIHK